MSGTRLAMAWSSFWGRQVAQWGIMLAIVLTVVVVLARKAEEVQALAEMAATKETVAALRTALIFAFVHQQVRPSDAPSPLDPNPFLQLDRLPPHYAGHVAMQDAAQVTPGNWFYDPVCQCVGYRLLHPQWLNQPPGSIFVGWRVIREGNGVQTLRAFAPYRWFGQSVS